MCLHGSDVTSAYPRDCLPKPGPPPGPSAVLVVRRQDLGAALWRLSDLVRADERSRSFRAKAYRRAVWALDDLAPDLSDPSESMLAVPGIGSGVLRLIEEFRSHGQLELLDRLEAMYPEDASRLRRLPRMTPTLLRSLKGELGVERVSDLIGAVESGGVEAMRGVGPTTAERWARTLELFPSPEAVPASQAAVLADDLGRHLRRHLGGAVWAAGSVRTLDEWAQRIDLVAEVEDLEGARTFLEETAVARFSGSWDGDAVRLRTHDDLGVLVHPVPPDRVGARLLEVTGPPDHVHPLLASIGDERLTESEIYERSGRPWVPPAARGLPTEIAAGVIRLEDVKGDLHLHTDASPDGRMSLLEILTAAVDRGYEYVLITDHTAGLRFGGLDGEGLLRQAREIEAIKPRFPDLAVLHGAELNIGRDGSLDIGDEVLSQLDLAVAGLHSNFDLDRSEQTARVLTAIEHPMVRVLAHPTGRRLGNRPAVDLDIDAVISSAVENRVALEVNGHRDRLDLSARLAAQAIAAGAMLAADSDAHRIAEMGNIANAVATMQKAGVSSGSVINALPFDRFREWSRVFG